MFYILNFATHHFTSCDSEATALLYVSYMLSAGFDKSDIEIVNGFIDGSRMTLDEFFAMREETR